MSAIHTHASPPSSRDLQIGIAAALAAALIGSAWQITSRHGVTTSLGPLEVAMLRYGVPTFALLPLLLRGALFPRQLPTGASRGLLFIVAAGGGLPFGLVVLAGAQWAPAAHMGIFMAGALPLFTALGAWLVSGEKLSALRLVGLGLLCAGIVSVGINAPASTPGAWRGDLLFLLAAVLWAAHSLAFRRCGLSPWQDIALQGVCRAWSRGCWGW
jgi:drug/metabolite transporter (DMT)-like permease